jgi:hypothetical protein
MEEHRRRCRSAAALAMAPVQEHLVFTNAGGSKPLERRSTKSTDVQERRLALVVVGMIGASWLSPDAFRESAMRPKSCMFC